MKVFSKHRFTQNTNALGLMASEMRLIMFSSIITLWELSVAMETRVPVRSGQKPNAVNPLHQ